MDVQALLTKAKEGFASIPLTEVQKHTALENLKNWLTSNTFQTYRPQILDLFDQKAWSTLLDSFYRVIPFGTGGRRGRVGVGTNRINPFTISTSVQGHIEYLKQKFPDKQQLSVVIAFDVRQFSDLHGVFDSDRPNNLKGIRSKDFAQLAACVYAAGGVRTYLLDPSYETFISTPELSYLIRSYQADAGLNISASHNHPDDNGGKFYNQYGGQPIAPEDQKMSNLVEKIKSTKELPFEEVIRKGLVHWITDEKRHEYIEVNLALQSKKPSSPAIVAFTPMHGTGSTSVGALLQEAGYTVHYLESQVPFDGAFTNVRYRIPNPEVAGSMEDVLELGKERNADLALATDPDADRLGLGAPDRDGKWHFFTGNQIGALLTQYLLSSKQKNKTLSESPKVVKTEVTTDLIRRITESFDGICVGNLLVGFKYIGDALHQWESKGEFLGVQGSLDDYVFGTEESHGYLVTHQVRDKDAAGAALYLTEYASELKAQGKTLYDAMQEIYVEHGYFSNQLVAMIMEGAVGLARIRLMQEKLRENPPREIGGVKVLKFTDHWDQQGRFGAFRSETDRSSRNVLVFHLEGEARLVLRPSGTEPKVKLYIEVPSEPCSKQELPMKVMSCRKTSNHLRVAFAKEILSRIGIELPDYGLAISDLVSIDNKVKIASEIFPEWKQQAKSQSDPTKLGTWLQETLQSINSKPKALLKEAKTLFLDGLMQQGENQELINRMAASFKQLH